MQLKPMDSAYPSSRSMVAGSNVCSCHISSWLTAVLGIKSEPRSQPFEAYQALARSGVHTGRCAAAVTVQNSAKQIVRNFREGDLECRPCRSVQKESPGVPGLRV